MPGPEIADANTAAVIAAVFAGVTTLVSAVGVVIVNTSRKKTNDIHHQVETNNGKTLGESVSDIKDKMNGNG